MTDLIPVSDAQAKAIEEAIKTLRAAGGFLREAFGTVPEDVVALLGGNLLKVRRAENLIRTLAKAQERLQKDGIKVEAASLSLGLRILVAAADESREELQDLWARLLAAAADPERARFFRLAFIEAAKRMDPLDAAVLKTAQEKSGRLDGNARQMLAGELHVSRDEIDVSVSNLVKLDLINPSPLYDPGVAFVSALGREFLRAVAE